jgi:hypothetical protein
LAVELRFALKAARSAHLWEGWVERERTNSLSTRAAAAPGQAALFSKRTAQDRILELLERHWCDCPPADARECRTGRHEVPLPWILDLRIGQYNTRIKELRAQGHRIYNRTEWRGRVRHSWFVYRGKT